MLFHLRTLVHLLFPRFKTFLEGIFWNLFELRCRSHFDGINVGKMGSLQTDLILGKRKKSHGVKSGEYVMANSESLLFLVFRKNLWNHFRTQLALFQVFSKDFLRCVSANGKFLKNHTHSQSTIYKLF